VSRKRLWNRVLGAKVRETEKAMVRVCGPSPQIPLRPSALQAEGKETALHDKQDFLHSKQEWSDWMGTKARGERERVEQSPFLNLLAVGGGTIMFSNVPILLKRSIVALQTSDVKHVHQ
jgi:hypothetical protein